MEKRYQVFVSSTYSDLKSERQTVMQTLMEMDCIPAGMELFPSIDEDQLEFIKKVIDDCDYYLIIVAGCYGSLADDGVSYTEKEYDYAVSKGIKVIALLRNDLDEIPVNKTDADHTKKQKLDLFIDKLKTGRLVKFWKDEKELAGLVALSLNKTIKQYPAAGWIRGNSAITDEKIYMELEILRKENCELKNKANMSEKTNTSGINYYDDINSIADFDSEYTFKGKQKLEGTSQYSDWEMKDTQKNLFSAIAPYCLEMLDDNESHKYINLYFTNKQTNKIFISKETLHTIKIQFMALGLISHDGISWELSEKGKKEMVKCRVIRKNSITPAST